jgi:hypothetical protein
MQCCLGRGHRKVQWDEAPVGEDGTRLAAIGCVTEPLIPALLGAGQRYASRHGALLLPR